VICRRAILARQEAAGSRFDIARGTQTWACWIFIATKGDVDGMIRPSERGRAARIEP
jgi:hypothetical protein